MIFNELKMLVNKKHIIYSFLSNCVCRYLRGGKYHLKPKNILHHANG